MVMNFRCDYTEMDDRQIVELATKPLDGHLPDGKAIAYLLTERYSFLLKSKYNKVFDGRKGYYKECLDDLYCYLHDGETEWQKLKGFEWRSSFGTWLDTTAYNRFLYYKQHMIDKPAKILSTDETNEKGQPIVVLPDDGERFYNRNERRVLVLEAITQLKNDDQRYAIVKQLKGYSCKDIAKLIKLRWAKKGIVRYGYRKVEGHEKRQRFIVEPDETYVDSLLQHARQELKKILTPNIR